MRKSVRKLVQWIGVTVVAAVDVIAFVLENVRGGNFLIDAPKACNGLPCSLANLVSKVALPPRFHQFI